MFSSMFVISSKHAGFVAVDFLIFYIVRGRVLALYVISGLCFLLSLFPCSLQAMFSCVDLLKWRWVFCNSCSSLPEGGTGQGTTAEGLSFWGHQRWSVEGTLGKNDPLPVGIEPQLMYLKQNKKSTDWSTWDNDLGKLRASVVEKGLKGTLIASDEVKILSSSTMSSAEN